MGGSRAVDVLREGPAQTGASAKGAGVSLRHRSATLGATLGNFYIKTAVVRRRRTCITVTPSTSEAGHLLVGRKLNIELLQHSPAAPNVYIEDACN